MARIDRDLEVPEALGPLRPAVERAGRLRPDDRPDADELGILLARPRPSGSTRPGRSRSWVRSRRPHRRRTGRSTPAPHWSPLPARRPTFVADATDGRGGRGMTRRGPPTTPAGRARTPPAMIRAGRIVAGGGGRSCSPPSCSSRSAPAASSPRPAPDPDLRGAGRGRQPDRRPRAHRGAERLDPRREADPTRRHRTGRDRLHRPGAGRAPRARAATLVVVVSEGNALTDVPADLVGRPLAEVVADARAGRARPRRRPPRSSTRTSPAGNVVRVDGEVDGPCPEGDARAAPGVQGPRAPHRAGASPPTPPTTPSPASSPTLRLVPERAPTCSATPCPAGVVISLSEAPGAPGAPRHRDHRHGEQGSRRGDRSRPAGHGPRRGRGRADQRRAGRSARSAATRSKEVVASTPAAGETGPAGYRGRRAAQALTGRPPAT